MKIDIINVIGKWFDLNEKGQDIQAQQIAQAKELDDFEPKLKNCSTFGQVKTAFPEIFEKLYIGFIMKFLAKKKINLKGIKIGDKTYNFTVKDCLKDAPQLKKDYNAEVASYFRSNAKPLGFMRNLDTNIKDKWADFRADLKAVNSPEVEKVEVEVINKITLNDLEQSAKALSQQWITLGNKSTKSNPSISKQEVLQPREKLKQLAEEFLESSNSKYKFKDLVKML